MLTGRYGKTALVTGASSGIGEAFARRLAALGCNVVGIGRRMDRLERLRDEIARNGTGSLIPIELDLGKPGSGELLAAEMERRNLVVDLLVNNAGFGLLGEFETLDRERSLSMVDLNCRAVVDLTHVFLPGMKARRRGAVIIVSSVVGAIPVPWFAVYAATKSFDLYFGEALHGECRSFGVDVLTVLPGLTRTEFQAGAGLREYHSPYRSAEQVVSSALGALGKKAIVVDGWMNKLAVHGSRFLPRCLVLPISKAVMRMEMKIPPAGNGAK